ncbi:MAG TPA: hypothetical protein PK156_20165 [Polyangium sp.]|nr:hypothetical protein [Polyangium sp.]
MMNSVCKLLLAAVVFCAPLLGTTSASAGSGHYLRIGQRHHAGGWFVRTGTRDCVRGCVAYRGNLDNCSRGARGGYSRYRVEWQDRDDNMPYSGAQVGDKYDNSQQEMPDKSGSGAQVGDKYGDNQQEMVDKYGNSPQEMSDKYGNSQQEMSDKYGNSPQEMSDKYGDQQDSADYGDEQQDSSDDAQQDSDDANRVFQRR